MDYTRIIEQQLASRKSWMWRRGFIEGFRLAGGITQDEWQTLWNQIKDGIAKPKLKGPSDG